MGQEVILNIKWLRVNDRFTFLSRSDAGCISIEEIYLTFFYFLFFYFNRFPVDDNANMKSVVEYFQEIYGFTIRLTHLPCLQVGNQKKANYLPMEVKIWLVHACKFWLFLLVYFTWLDYSINLPLNSLLVRHAKLLKGNDIQKG